MKHVYKNILWQPGFYTSECPFTDKMVQRTRNEITLFKFLLYSKIFSVNLSVERANIAFNEVILLSCGLRYNKGLYYKIKTSCQRSGTKM